MLLHCRVLKKSILLNRYNNTNYPYLLLRDYDSKKSKIVIKI